MSEKIKKALRIAVNVGCGFEGDAEDAVSLLGLIEANEARIAELEAERDQAKAIVSRLRDFLFDYTQFHISTNPEERWWALVDKFDELVKESEE